MAHHKSARKRIRRNERQTQVNRSRVSRIRTFVRRFEDALASGDAQAAATAFALAQPELQRGVTKGVLHRNTAARKISRMARRIRSMAA